MTQCKSKITFRYAGYTKSQLLGVKLRPHAKMPVIRFGGGQGQFLTFVWILIESAPEFPDSLRKLEKVQIWDQFAK